MTQFLKEEHKATHFNAIFITFVSRYRTDKEVGLML